MGAHVGISLSEQGLSNFVLFRLPLAPHTCPTHLTESSVPTSNRQTRESAGHHAWHWGWMNE